MKFKQTMTKLYSTVLLVFSSTVIMAQDFITTPANSISTTVFLNEYVTAEIDFEHNTSGDLTLGWDLIEKNTPAGWDYSYCDYNTCYDATYTHGTMAPFGTGNHGFIKVNVLTTSESSAYFKFSVYNVLTPTETDTIEFWFNGVMSVKPVVKEELAIFPNPVSFGDNWSIKNVPLNSTIEVFNSLGQKVLKLSSSQESTVVFENRLNKGAYIVRIQHDGILETRKLIIR